LQKTAEGNICYFAFQLTNVGIPADQVTWSRVTLTSDRWIAVRHGKKKEEGSSKSMVGLIGE